MMDKNYFIEQTKVLVIIPNHMKDMIVKNRTYQPFEGIEGPCSLQTDERMGEEFRYNLCGVEYRGLVIVEGAKISKGALEYLMTRMRNRFEDKGVPWVFDIGEEHTAMLESLVGEKVESLLSQGRDYYTELSLRKTIDFYRNIVGLKLEGCDYKPQGVKMEMGDITLREYPHRGVVILSQDSEYANHTDLIEVSVAEIPTLVKRLEQLYKLQVHSK